MLMHDYERGASLKCDIEAMQSVCKVTLQQQSSILKELWRKLTESGSRLASERRARDPLPPSILPQTSLTFPPSLSSTSSPITHPLNTNATQHTRRRNESVKDAKRSLLSAASSRAAEHDNTFLSNAETPQKDATAHTHHAFLAETREPSAPPTPPPQARGQQKQKQLAADVSVSTSVINTHSISRSPATADAPAPTPAQFSQRGEGAVRPQASV
jgi:hypothetical protein